LTWYNAYDPCNSTGFTPVIGHPERNVGIQTRPERLRPIVEHGVLVQVKAASLDGRYGRPSEDAARSLVPAALRHLIARRAAGPVPGKHEDA
jgi:protein-tyrosine phosphatase